MSRLMKIVKPFIKGLTSFDETFRKLTLNVVKGIIYLKIMEIEMFTLQMWNDAVENLNIIVSVGVGGGGYDVHHTNGEYIETVDSLAELEMNVMAFVYGE